MPTPSFEPQSDNDLPKWLNQDYIQDALCSQTNDDSVKIIKFDMKPAIAKGENYVSDMFRIRLEIVSDKWKDSKKCSYVVKASFQDGGGNSLINKVLESYQPYKCEIIIYDKILPKFKEILQTIGFTEELAPETVKVDYKRESIVFEDLNAKHYVMVPRLNGLNMEHAKLILKKVAKFHAASAVLNELNSDIFRTFDRGLFNKHSESFAPIFLGNFEVCGKIVSGWKGFECYGEKLLKLKSKLLEYGQKVMEPKRDNFNVLIHGDLWCNNTMFKYNDKNEPDDVILIDFQFSCWSSPTIDLHYFFNTSLDEDIRINRLDELVHFYYLNLTDTLRELKFRGRIPTLQEFWLQYIETSFYALFAVTISQPMMLNDETEDASIAVLLKDDERARRFRYAIYNNEKVQKNLRRLLPVFDRRGLLDVVN